MINTLYNSIKIGIATGLTAAVLTLGCDIPSNNSNRDNNHPSPSPTPTETYEVIQFHNQPVPFRNIYGDIDKKD